MIININRFLYTPYGTYSNIRIDDYECKAVERPWLNNLPFKSCIPCGEYPAFIRFSPDRQANIIELKDVPGRTVIQIHIANLACQLHGCIAPGLDHTKLQIKYKGNWTDGLGVSSSGVAFKKIMSMASMSDYIVVNVKDSDNCMRLGV